MSPILNRSPLLAASAALGVVASCSSSPLPTPAAPINVSGNAYTFSQHGGPIPNAQISILELPEHQTTSGADGTFQFNGLPGDVDLTFTLKAPGIVDTQTGTFHSTTDVKNITFQAPDPGTYSLLANLTGVTPRSDRCQIATTVTRQGLTGNDTGGNGEPGSTASIDPPLPADAAGPVYFNTTTTTAIYPDPNLTETSTDGGVLFLNVPPGDYVLRGHKEGVTFTEVHLKCVAGKVVNASPPFGIAALSGGIGPKVTK